MSQFDKTVADHFAIDGKPKRILALDGGGLRGILTLGILESLEAVLRERHGDDDDFRLSDYFDLVAGTSTGAIIAAGLAQGDSVATLVDQYMALGAKVFEKSFLRKGLFRAKYHEGKLSEELRGFYGADTTLGSDKLRTGLLIVTKRLDTGSVWPLGNNPQGKYFASSSPGIIANGEYPLWKVVRASTAAPAFFDPESITIAEEAGAEKVDGEFVDGGVSPFNNPSVQALMYATLAGYRVGWPFGGDNLLLVSLGTGSADPSVQRTSLTAKHAINSLMSLMNDCASLQEILLQWMSSSSTASEIDSELGDLGGDTLGPAELLSYLRYNIELNPDEVQALTPEVTDPGTIKSLSEMDDPANMDTLYRLGQEIGKRDVSSDDFAGFDVSL